MYVSTSSRVVDVDFDEVFGVLLNSKYEMRRVSTTVQVMIRIVAQRMKRSTVVSGSAVMRTSIMSFTKGFVHFGDERAYEYVWYHALRRLAHTLLEGGLSIVWFRRFAP